MASEPKAIDAETDSTAPAAESESGLDSNVAGALSSLFGIISRMILFRTEKDNPFVRWYTAQSMAFNVLLGVASIVLNGFVVWIHLMSKAYQSETSRLPVAAGIADKLV